MNCRTTTLSAVALAAGLCSALGAHAADINNLGALAQAEFRSVSQDLGSALSYKGLIPAEPLGITGFDFGLAVTGTKLQSRTALQAASSGTVPATLPVPTLRVHKGLPFNIDVGVSYAAVPSSNIKLIGGELRWAVLSGGVAMPAVALRASMTKLSGVNQLDLSTTGLDVSISKGFLMLTPYAGVGTVRVKSTPNGVGLNSESFSQSKVFAGLNFNLGLANLAFEGDKTGDATSYGMKLGFRF
jgi:hypothetical protein